MYGDMSDDQLLISIRNKYYSDIPMASFVKAIDYDTDREKYDPTSGMSGFGRFSAGVGKAFTDVAQGLSQFLPGGASREDVAEKRATDAALMRAGAGMAGNITGNVAALIPTAFVPGAASIPGAAAIGALSGLAQPSESTGETLKNTAIGGVLGPTGVLAGRAVGAGFQGVKGLVEPFTKAGQERIAARTLRQFASDPQKAAAALQSAKPLVPGSQPTMAQASGDAGLAQLERTLQNNPESGRKLADAYAAQRAARLGAVQDVAGVDEYYNAIKEGRSIFAREDYAKAMTQGVDKKMADALKPQIESLMKRPSIQSAKSVAVRLANESDQAIGDFGSIEGLDWLKKALDNQISKAAQPGSSIGKEELRGLVQTKGDLMAVMEELAPAYKAANDNFAAMSRQVNSMDAARSLLDRFQPALGRYGASTREHADAYARALEGAKESVKKSTGMNKSLSQVMDRGDIGALENVARDLGRQAKASDLGRAVGSNTAQNLAAQNLLRRTLGPTGLPQKWSESTALQAFLSPYTGVAKLAGAEQRVLDRLLDASLDPIDAAGLLMLAQPKDGGRSLLPYMTPGLLGLVNSSQK